MSLSKPVVRYLIIAAVFLLGLLILSVFLGGYIRQVVVLPIEFVIYLFGLMLRTTPQSLFWGAMLALALVLVFRSLASPRAVMEPLTVRGLKIFRHDRFSFWLVQVWMARRGGYGRMNFHHHLRRLVIEMLAYQEHLGRREVEQRLKEGSFDLPVEIQTYLNTWYSDRYERVPSLWRRIGQRFSTAWQQLIYRLNAPGPERSARLRNAAELKEIETVLAYLESQLEIKNEHEGK